MSPSRGGRRKPSPQYARVFTALAAGGYLVITGVIGYDVFHRRAGAGRWVDATLWWQIALGLALLLLAGFLIRRLPSSWLAMAVPRQITKHAGSGQSEGARQPRRRLLP